MWPTCVALFSVVIKLLQVKSFRDVFSFSVFVVFPQDHYYELMNDSKIKLVMGIYWNCYIFWDTAYWTLKCTGRGVNIVIKDTLSEHISNRPILSVAYCVIYYHISSTPKWPFPLSPWPLLGLNVVHRIHKPDTLKKTFHWFFWGQTSFTLQHVFSFSFVDVCIIFVNCDSFSDSLSQLLQMLQGSEASFNEPYAEFRKNNLTVINHTVWAQLWHPLRTRSRTPMPVVPFVMTSVLSNSPSLGHI